ncbi:cache domain-containing protein [Streptomyces sp. 150FB]|uniref:cache domain-containing protein n=1 Tax=Streptomyces sp. 150FB TaxID=1576605 RepID=UPI000695F237|nr:cache domain-containing protein [Streptomyces sp. 150FB]
MSLLGGIRPPIALLSALLLALAGLTALGLGTPGGGALPKAVRISQQHFAEDGAMALRTSLDESITDLDRTASLLNAGEPVAAETVLDKLGSVYQKWTGSAVIEIKSGKLLAAHGENIPFLAIDRRKLSGDDGLAPRLVRLPDGEERLLTLALLSWSGHPQQLLITSHPLKVPEVSLGTSRAIAVVGAGGAILSSDGLGGLAGLGGLEDVASGSADDGTKRTETKRAEEQLRTFAKLVPGKAEENPGTGGDPGSGGFLGVSGTMTGARISGERPLAGYATLAAPEAGTNTEATGFGLSVVTVVNAPENTGRTTDDWLFGLLSAAALLLIGALAVALLIGTVQRPLIVLLLESRRLAGGDLTRPTAVPRLGEARRVGEALERLRRQLLGGLAGAPGSGGESATGRGRRGRRVRTGALLAGSGILLLLWSVPMMLLLNRAGSTAVVPRQLVNDQRDRTATLTDRVRRALDERDADLLSVATLVGDRTTPEDMSAVLERVRTAQPRYRSLYVLSADGKVLAKAGDAPPPTGSEHEPGGARITVLGTGSKEPRITGYAQLPGRNGASLVGEFRIDFLNSLLNRPGLGEIRIVDAERRVLGSNNGYLAFEKLPSDRLDSLVEAAQKETGSARSSGVLFRDGGGIQLAAAAPFSGGAAQPLGWTVLSWQPASALAIPEYSAQNRTVLAGLLGVTATALCLGWLQIVVVRPLRALAEQAEALANGDRRTVLFPRHHDEVGAVTRSLELLRQQLQERRAWDGIPSESESSTLAGRS